MGTEPGLGEKFFPVAPNHRAPKVARDFILLADLPRILGGGRPEDALQGTVSRSGEVMLLALGVADGGESMVG